MGKSFYVPDAQVLSRYRTYKSVNLIIVYTVHTYERAEGVHISVSGEFTVEYTPLHTLAHLVHEPGAHAYPCPALLKPFGYIRDSHLVYVSELINHDLCLRRLGVDLHDYSPHIRLSRPDGYPK